MATLITFLTAFALYFALKQYRMYLNRKLELNLFRLRDKLRSLAISGDIKKNDWTFAYYDTSISKMASTFSKVNIWHAMYITNNHDGDLRLSSFNRHLHLAFNKNHNYKDIQDEYVELLNMYMAQKHFFIIASVVAGISSFRFLSKLKYKAKSSVRNLVYMPETSTAEVYYKHLKIA